MFDLHPWASSIQTNGRLRTAKLLEPFRPRFRHNRQEPRPRAQGRGKRMKGRQIKTALGLAMVLVVIAAVAVGCFAASGSWTAEPAGNEVGTPVEWKPEPSLAGGLQRFSSYQELKDFLKTAPSYPGYWYWGAGRGELMLDGALTFSVAENGPDYSKTNIQVEGVDEADIVKSDGEYIYLATDNRLIIARAYPPEKAGIVYETELGRNIEGLFI